MKETRTVNAVKIPKGYFTQNHDLYWMVLPFLLFLAIFWAWPLYGVQIAFRDFWPTRGFFGSKWVGFKHFLQFFASPLSGQILINTVTISVTLLAINFPAAIILALCINEVENKRTQNAIKTFTYVPYFFSVVAVASLALNFLSPTYGLINNFLRASGGKSIDFLAQPALFRYLLSGLNLWQFLGWNTIIFLAAISNINPELYEVATIDGASRWQRLLHITLPHLVLTIVILLILRVGHLLRNDVMRVLLMQNPLNIDASEVLGTYVYKTGILNARYSFAAAVGLFETAVSITLIWTSNAIARRLGTTAFW